MAYSIELTGIGKDGLQRFSIEPEWWERSKLGERVHLNWTSTNETGSYTDDDADLTRDELRLLHEQFRDRLLKDIEFYKKLSDKGYYEIVSKLERYLHQLDSAVAENPLEPMSFHIRVYEWDSGF